MDILDEAKKLFPYTQQLRRDFHRHPELGFEELRTAGIVARELNKLGLEVSTGIAETGVVALLEGNREGPTVLLRFDMDALPIDEGTGADYASQRPGVMHACGHDGHTAVGLAVARLLHAHQTDLSGKVKFVFQPAEEGLGGAERMVAHGALEAPRPDVALAVHLWNEKPVGWLGLTAGPVMATSDTFHIIITGKGGHGANPHQTIDPVVAGAQIITSLQSIAARNVNPLKSVVISVTAIRAGEAFNVIPSQMQLKGTIRTFEASVRELVHNRFRNVVDGIAQTYGCTAEIELKRITPAVVNDIEVVRRVQDAAASIFSGHEIDEGYRTMGSEDMAFFMRDIPGGYIFVGSANPDKGLDAPHHNPRFDFDEAAMPSAVALLAAAAFSYLKG